MKARRRLTGDSRRRSHRHLDGRMDGRRAGGRRRDVRRESVMAIIFNCRQLTPALGRRKIQTASRVYPPSIAPCRCGRIVVVVGGGWTEGRPDRGEMGGVARRERQLDGELCLHFESIGPAGHARALYTVWRSLPTRARLSVSLPVTGRRSRSDCVRPAEGENISVSKDGWGCYE